MKRLNRDIVLVYRKNQIYRRVLKYWSVLKSFSNSKKIHYIPPISQQKKKKIDLLPILKKKLNNLILFFAKQYSFIDNGSEILSVLHLKTNKSLSDITFSKKCIEKAMQS